MQSLPADTSAATSIFEICHYRCQPPNIKDAKPTAISPTAYKKAEQNKAHPVTGGACCKRKGEKQPYQRSKAHPVMGRACHKRKG